MYNLRMCQIAVRLIDMLSRDRSVVSTELNLPKRLAHFDRRKLYGEAFPPPPPLL